jgi:phosphatidylinositol glycan class Q protein
MFNRPHPTRMQYMSLDPISLALGDKQPIAEREELDSIDTEEVQEKARIAKLVEKLKLHTVVRHVPSQKEQVLPVILNQINCAFETGQLLEKNSKMFLNSIKRRIRV